MKLIFAALLSFFSIKLWAQSSPKLYGYRQTVSAGVKPNQNISEDGAVVTDQPKRMENYFIYFATSSKNRLYPVAMFIEGVRYDVTATAVKQTPVLEQSNPIPGQKAKVLVPKTVQRVYQLVPSGASAASAKVNAGIISSAKSHALVLVYRQGGKTYTRSLKTLTQLDAAAML